MSLREPLAGAAVVVGGGGDDLEGGGKRVDFAAVTEAERQRDRQTALVWSGITVGMAVFSVAMGFALQKVNSNSEMPQAWAITSGVVGWFYFAAWSVSFYPQAVQNFMRRSVVGLSFDYQGYNLIGFSAYTAYNCALFFNPVIRAQYRAEYGSEPKVEANDVFFAIHAVVLTVVTVVQCFVYERGAQRLSVTASVLIVCAALAALVYAGLLGANVVHKTSWLHFLIFVSYIKLGVTLIKYIPQAYMNFVRRTTDGFNMQNVLLDFTGGFLSVAQLLMDCAVTKDWSGIAGDPVKFGLGLTSMVFDVLFMVQHFVLFPANNARYARARAAMALLSADDADELRTILNSDGITRDPSVLSVHSPRVRAVLHDIHNNSPSPSTGDSASLLPSQ